MLKKNRFSLKTLALIAVAVFLVQLAPIDSKTHANCKALENPILCTAQAQLDTAMESINVAISQLVSNVFTAAVKAIIPAQSDSNPATPRKPPNSP